MKNFVKLTVVISVLVILGALAALMTISCQAVTYNPEEDYLDRMIECVISDRVADGRTYAEYRQRKIKELNLDYPEIEFDSLYWLAHGMYAEAGSYWIEDDFQKEVGSVILNRVNSPEFPDTCKSVILQKGQYAAWIKDKGAHKTITPDRRTVENAAWLLANGSVLPNTVVFQANFPQGSGIYKETEVKKLGTTYFCYSNYPEKYS